MKRALFAALLALAACDTNPLTVLPEGVFVITNATEYRIASPPQATIVTVQNRTSGPITVRRCLIRGSAVDAVGVDLVLEHEIDGAWQPIDLGFSCLTVPDAPRADVVLAPMDTTVVARIIVIQPDRLRVRVAYGVGADAPPTATATSKVFVYR
jgi:hypothetical protein